MLNCCLLREYRVRSGIFAPTLNPERRRCGGNGGEGVGVARSPKSEESAERVAADDAGQSAEALAEPRQQSMLYEAERVGSVAAHLGVARHSIVSPRHEGARPLNAVEENHGEALAARLCYQFYFASHTVVLLFVARRRLYEQHLRFAHDEELAGCLYVMVFCKDGAFAGHNGWSFYGLAKLMFLLDIWLLLMGKIKWLVG